VDEPRRGLRPKGGWERALRYSTAGLELSLSVVVGYFLGHWLDGQLGCDPYLMIAFVIIGTASGMRGLYRTAKRAMREQDRDEDRSDSDSGGRRP
jgi:ATP synthase protein I